MTGTLSSVVAEVPISSFISDTSPGYRLIVAVLLAMALMLVDHRSELVKPVRHVIGYLTAPAHLTTYLPRGSVKWAGDQFRSRNQLQQQNARLQQQLVIAQHAAQRLAVLEAENARLRQLLNSSAQLDARVLVAEIIGIEPDPSRRELIINKGQHAKVHDGQAVLDANGLIGQVVEAGPLTSRVLMIVDASHALSVMVNRTGVRAILAGTGSMDRLRLLYVPETADIQIGDLLVTTGLDQRFPRGYPVAEVVQIEHSPGAAFVTIEASPAANLDRTSHVLLVEQGQTSVDSSAGDSSVGESP